MNSNFELTTFLESGFWRIARVAQVHQYPWFVLSALCMIKLTVVPYLVQWRGRSSLVRVWISLSIPLHVLLERIDCLKSQVHLKVVMHGLDLVVPFRGLGVWYGLAYTVYIHPKTPTRFFTWWFEKSAEGCTSTCHSICSCGQSQFNNCRGRNEEGCTSCDERPSDISRRLRIHNHGNDYMKYVQGCTLCSHGRRRHYFPNADQLFNAFQWLWMIQWIGKGYLVWLQLLIYFGCRLCLLHFKRGSQFAGEEFCWHILRGVCWSFITFLGLWFYSRTPPRQTCQGSTTTLFYSSSTLSSYQSFGMDF